MDIKLIAFDLDGTFLDRKKQIPPDNLRAIELAAAHGIHIVPSTGRIFSGIPQQLRELPYLRYFITSNGASVYDKQKGEKLCRAEIPVPQAVALYEYEDALPVIYDCYQNDIGYMSEFMYAQREEYVPDPGILRLVTELRIRVDELKSYLTEKAEPIQKLQVYFKDPAERLRQLRELPALFPELLFSSSLPFNIEINSRDASKGQALMRLGELLGVDRSQILAFGDGINDMDMIKTAGLGVAMENAEAELKLCADQICESNDKAGVGRTIERLLG